LAAGPPSKRRNAFAGCAEHSVGERWIEMKRSIGRCFPRWFFLLLAQCLFHPVSAAERPNFSVVLIDDMGWEDLACFGNKEVATPHIDRLAEEGIRFEQFYVTSPIC